MTKKLNLRRESLTELVADELDGIVGGVTGTGTLCICILRETQLTCIC